MMSTLERKSGDAPERHTTAGYWQDSQINCRECMRRCWNGTLYVKGYIHYVYSRK